MALQCVTLDLAQWNVGTHVDINACGEVDWMGLVWSSSWGKQQSCASKAGYCCVVLEGQTLAGFKSTA